MCVCVGWDPTRLCKRKVNNVQDSFETLGSALAAGRWSQIVQDVSAWHVEAVQMGEDEAAALWADLLALAHVAAEFPEVGQALLAQGLVEVAE